MCYINFTNGNKADERNTNNDKQTEAANVQNDASSRT